MIDRDAKPIVHRQIRPPIDIRYPGRRKVITRQEVEDNLVREPDPAIYVRDPFSETWTLRE